MFLAQTILALAMGVFWGPGADQVKVIAIDSLNALDRVVPLQSDCKDEPRAITVVVSADDPACGSSTDRKECRVVVRKAGECAGDDGPGSKAGVCKKVVIRGGEGGGASGCCGQGKLPDGCKAAGQSECCKKGKPSACGKAVEGSDCCALGMLARCGKPGGQPRVCRPGEFSCGGLQGGVDGDRCRIVVRKLGDSGDCPSAADALMLAKMCGDPKDGGGDASNRKMVVRCLAKDAGDDVEAGGPWLGIQFGPVPKPLAAHLNIEKNVGQMVLNVIEDSPADQAGLHQYDVIVGLDGKDASAEIGDFMDVVKAFEPGQKHKFALVRGGQPKDVTLTVGKRPEEIGAPKYKYESDLEELAQDNVFQRGGILRKTPEGDWVLEGFGPLENLNKFNMQLPNGEAFENLFDWAHQKPGSGCEVQIRTEKGESVQIKRDGGKITVTRTRKDDDGKAQVTTKTYDSEDALKKEDADAYKMMKECPGGGIRWFGDKGNRIFITPGGDRLKCLPGDMDANLQEMMEKAGQAHKKAAEAQELFRQKMENQTKSQGALSDEYTDLFASRKARTSFEIGEGGKIVVTTRKGQEELTQVFSSAAAMKKARPDLYEKFQKLHRGEKKDKGEEE